MVWKELLTVTQYWARARSLVSERTMNKSLLISLLNGKGMGCELGCKVEDEGCCR